MPSHRVLLIDRAWPDWSIEKKILDEIDAELVTTPDPADPTIDENSLIELARDVDAIGVNWAKVTGPVIEAAEGCKIVTRFGIGLDNIAVETATDRGIPVTNVPDYCVPEVADHAVGLLLAMARDIGFFHHRIKGGEYDLSAGAPMRRLDQLTLGLVGLGRTGQAVIPRAKGFGMRVIGWNRSAKPDADCEQVDWDSLLSESDFLSLHLPLTPETRHIIDADALSKMKPTASVINTGRGGLIDHEALWNAISNDRLAGAALDVFDPEPPDLSEPLYNDERVVLTPHAAFVSEESLIDLRTRAARQIADALTGKAPENVRNL